MNAISYIRNVGKSFGYIAVVDDTRVIPVENSEILLGRHRSADIQFPNLSVSRYHAVLTYSDGIFLLCLP